MSASNPSSLSAAHRRRNQLILIILWLVPFTLMGIAGFVYYMVQSGQMTLGSKNHGILLTPPVLITDLLSGNETLSVRNEEGDVKSVFEGKWTMVVRGNQECDSACREALYLTRQLHIRLDKNANRVQRIYLYDAPSTNGNAPSETGLSKEFAEYIKSEHHLLKAYPVEPTAIEPLDKALVANSGETAAFFLVDPQGWAMMYYLKEHEGNAMLADLKHLLKFSREG